MPHRLLLVHRSVVFKIFLKFHNSFWNMSRFLKFVWKFGRKFFSRPTTSPERFAIPYQVPSYNPALLIVKVTEKLNLRVLTCVIFDTFNNKSASYDVKGNVCQKRHHTGYFFGLVSFLTRLTSYDVIKKGKKSQKRQKGIFVTFLSQICYIGTIF